MTRKELLGYARLHNCIVVKVDYGFDVAKIGGVLLGYNSGLYGWNWNAYTIGNNFIIIQGYRNFPSYDDNTGYSRCINGGIDDYKATINKGRTEKTALKHFMKHFQQAEEWYRENAAFSSFEEADSGEFDGFKMATVFHMHYDKAEALAVLFADDCANVTATDGAVFHTGCDGLKTYQMTEHPKKIVLFNRSCYLI